ncbi:MAG: MFS transporter [Ignavibacteriaceae bacterium]
MLKKIPKQVVILGLISLFTDMASEMLYPITPIFLASVLGASMISVGVIEGLAEITAGFLKGYFGFLSDKLGKRSIFVVGGYSISALSKPLPGIFPNIFIVLISRVTDRIGKGMRTAPRDALLAGYSNSSNTGAIFGFHRGMDTLGAVLGPLIALLLLNIYDYNYNLIFIIAFIPSVIAVAFTFYIKDKKVEIRERKKLQYVAFWEESPRTYKTLVILITIFSLVNSSDVFLILKSRNISHSDVTAILGYVFYNLIYAVSSYPAGLISDKIGKKKIYILGLIIFSAVYFGFASSDNFILTWILFAFYGIYAASTEGILKAWISDLVAYEKVASAVGLITMLSSIAMFLGSILTGYLWDAFGSSVPFYFSSAVSLIIALSLIRIHK